VKRINFLLSPPFIGILIASLSVLIEFPTPVRAQDATPVAAPKAVDPAADDDAKKAEAVLQDMFKKESGITNSLGMVFVWLKEGYRVGKYEVTQQQYEALTGTNSSRFSGPLRPVENVTFNEASRFCQQLTETELKAGKLPKGYAYSLPTEQQWEHFVGDARLEDAITSFLGDRRTTENVGGLGPNSFGLHDVRGNVWEWSGGAVGRGASWMSHGDYIFVPFRYVAQPDQRYDDVGFRLVLQGSPASK